MLQSINQLRQNGELAGETELAFFTKSSIHGTGGFAKTNIPAGTPVIEYVGEKISKQESLRRCEENNEYIFTLNEQYDLDGKVERNLARFINHSCEPNCDAEIEADRVWITANRPIRPGEELSFNYGFDLEEYKDYPCSCGSPGCVGYMIAEEYFDHVRRQRDLTSASITT